MERILCISLGYEGGCVLYANKLMDYFPDKEIDIWISSTTELPAAKYSKKIKVKKGAKGQFISTLLMLPYYVVQLIYALIRKKYHCVVVFGPHNWDLVWPLVFKCFGKKSFLVVHDGIMHEGEKSSFHQKLITTAMKFSTHLIFLSENVRQLVKSQLGIDKPFCIVQHGMISYNSDTKQKIKELPSLPSLLFIGRINYYKGIDILADALSRFDYSKIASITIAGKFDSRYSKLSGSIAHPKVKIIDKYLTEKEFDDFLLASDFLLMPYLEATQSGIAAVSIGYAKPAIVTRVGAMEEQFTESSAYFMNELSSNELVNVVHQAISEPTVYVEKQKALIAQSKTLEWKTLSEKLYQYIQSN